MKYLLTILATLAVAFATAQVEDTLEDGQTQRGNAVENLEDGGGQPPVAVPVGSSSTATASAKAEVNVAPPWETRAGVEEAAKSFFQAKREYISCRGHGDNRGMKRAGERMRKHSNQLAAFRRQQAARDKGQDRRLDVHSDLVWKHESQINGKGGINDRLGKAEKDVKTLNDDLDAVTPAIAGVNEKFDGLTWWVLILTLVVLIGFSRRYWIHR